VQLELFPRTKFALLSDFHKLETSHLSWEEKIRLIQNPDFFKSPKSNEVIKQQHAEMLDNILGFRLRYIEEMLIAEALGFDPDGSLNTWGPDIHDGAQTWVGLDLKTLQTPYSEILRILQLLKIRPYQHIIDLGAAYGRMGIIIGGLYIKNSFQGYEFVKSRVDEGNRVYQELGFKRCELLTQDLASKSFTLPMADVYFIYDFGQVEHIERTLKQIELNATKRPVKVVVRGKYTKKIISLAHPWLELKYEGKLEGLFSIYVSGQGPLAHI
jgi:hypothetical protein